MKCTYACNSSEHGIARRQFLGTLAAAGVGSVAGGLGVFARPAAAAQLAKDQKRIVVFNMHGGLSQLESWDPKPGTDTGGPFRAIPTSVPGIQISALLPLTAQTKGILNKDTLAKIRAGGCVINCARGPHVVVPDLIAALDARHLAHAYLDVFDEEPLPADSPLWSHPNVAVTPHIAALTEPRTAAPVIVENIERLRRGEAALHLVDRAAGY